MRRGLSVKRKNTEIQRIRFQEIGSTNDYARSLRGEGKDLLVTAARQTGGKGTKGRSFSSEEGGVYLSKLVFYEEFPAKDAFTVMAGAAVAVCRTLESFGLSPVIKWANDVYVSDKKICGILIENVFSGNKLSSSLVGIGLNVCNRLPQELLDIATTMERELGARFSVEAVTEKLIEELDKGAEMSEYISRVGYMGQKATLLLGEEAVSGRLLSVDGQGGLLAEIDGEIRRLTAAEVSVRIKEK